MAERVTSIESFATQSLPPEDAVNSPSSIKATSTLTELHTLLESMTVKKFVFVSTGRDEDGRDEDGQDEENGSQGESDDECSEMEKDSQPSTDSDSFTDFTACANNALQRLRHVSQLFAQHKWPYDNCKPALVDIKAVGKVLRQLTRKEVYLCVLGRYNVGKSTLINALLNADILPTSRDAETAVTLYIKHEKRLEVVNDWREGIVTEKGPRLISLQPTADDNTDAVHGLQNIKKSLESVHCNVRNGTPKSDFQLEISIPAFSSIPQDCKITPYLVDTAGSNEVGQAELQHMTHVNLQTAAAYIYVMSYTELRNEQDYEALAVIFKKDKRIFEDGRIVIVVTHFDSSYSRTGFGKELSGQEVKSTMIRQINRVLPNANVSEDCIMPVSGAWACQARVYRATDGGMMLMSMLQLHPECTPATLIESIASDSSAMCAELEEASGIKLLEDKLRKMVQHLFHMWKINITLSCQGMITKSLAFLSEVQHKAEEHVKGLQEKIEQCNNVLMLHKKILKSVECNSDVLKTFRTKYDQDTEPGMKIPRETEVCIEKLMDDLKKRVSKGSYTPDDLNHDVNESDFQKEVERIMENLFRQKRFQACQECLRSSLTNFADRFGRMKAAAVTLYMTEGVRTTVSEQVKEEVGGTSIDDILEQSNKELQNFDIPEVKYGLKEKIKLFFDRLLFGALKVRIIRQEHLEVVRDNINTALKEHQRKFFESIKEPLILLFFKIYCQRVTSDLTTFHELAQIHNWRVDDRLQSTLREHQQIEQLHQQYKQWSDQLERFKDQVKHKATQL